MQSRKLIPRLAVGMVALVGVGAFAFWPVPQRITRKNFDRIEIGMSRAEVEVIVGPPGDYTTGPTHLANIGRRLVISFGDDGQLLSLDIAGWIADSAIICVGFNRSGVVEWKNLDDNSRLPQSEFDSVLWRAKRQWRKWFPE
jgi:hypothetical protein